MSLLIQVIRWLVTIIIITGGIVFFPWHILLLLGVLKLKLLNKGGSLEDPTFLFQITTIGTNPDSTQEVIHSIHENVSGYPYQVWVVTEPRDTNEYTGAEKIIVPREYSTPKNSTDKTRALHYSCQLREARGLTSSSRWIIFLDDDSKITDAYFQEILKMDPDSVGGQGRITVRNDYGQHFFSSLADNLRPSDCTAFCSLFNQHGGPVITHGEGLVVRADVEHQLGWDFGSILAEDFIFGRKLANQYPNRFEWLNAEVEGKSPLSWEDFKEQRRRWFWGAVDAVPHIDRKTACFVGFRYGTTFLGITAFLLGMLSFVFPIAFSLPVPLALLLQFNTIGLIAYYQYGCYHNTKHLTPKARIKYHLATLLLQYPISAYEIGSFIIGFFKGRPEHFNVIDKN